MTDAAGRPETALPSRKPFVIVGIRPTHRQYSRDHRPPPLIYQGERGVWDLACHPVVTLRHDHGCPVSWGARQAWQAVVRLCPARRPDLAGPAAGSFATVRDAC